MHPPLFRADAGSGDSAHFGHFQFKAFFGRTPPILLITSGLPNFAKYFTGHQWNALINVRRPALLGGIVPRTA
jgi:hypothetical protein